MKNKTLIGGLAALLLIVLVLFFCFWVGRKINDRLTTDQGRPDATRPDGQPQMPEVPKLPPANAEEALKTYLALGNPSNAGSSDPNNFLLANRYFVLSYNRDKKTANWAAWRISRNSIGDLDRPEPDPFRPDPRLPDRWEPVKPNDYTRSGFDRGHLTPSADRSASEEGMTETFLMTNIAPQTGDLNRGPWLKLEGYLRTLVTRGQDVYIFAGVYGEKGRIKRKIAIPTNSWKIAVAVPSGSPVSAIDENTRVIAVDMPNVKGIRNADWQIYRTTVRDLEQKTGFDFFSNLPKNLQDALETKTDKIDG